MSLQRTPPMSPMPTVFATPLQILQSYPSDSNISEVGEEAGASAASSLSNITSRSKRKREDITKSEMLDMFTALQKRQDEKFDIVLCSINEVKTSVNLMSSKYEEALTKINILEEERKVQNTQIQQLQKEVEMLQHYVRGTSVELRNIPQSQNESKDNLKTYISKIANIFDIPMQPSDIKDIYRINTKGAVKPIIADFSTVALKDNFLISYKKYNKCHKQEKLNTSQFVIGGISQPLYISENLTPTERKLYYLARQFAKNYNFRYCWTSFGRIFLRKAEGTPQIRLSCEADLDDLKDQ